jgi:flagellar biosynthesis protein FliP
MIRLDTGMSGQKSGCSQVHLLRWMAVFPWLRLLLALCFCLGLAGTAVAQTTSTGSPPAGLNITLSGIESENDIGVALQLVFLMTLLTLAPSILMLMTAFTRIIIVLGFVRNAIGVQHAPSNQVVVGIALFLTIFVMAPVLDKIQEEALQPFMNKEITSMEAMDRASGHLRTFMLYQTRQSDIEFFLGLSKMGPTQIEDIPMKVIIPSFVVSELRTAFQMGFLIYMPFVMIDFLIATTLMAMGMMMMPPAIISMPFKILLFVVVDGWLLVIRSLTQSFGL